MAKRTDIFLIIAGIGLGLQIWHMIREGEL